MPTRRRFGPLILVASLALLAAGCGGADDKSRAASATSAATTPTTAAAVTSPLVGEWRRIQTCEEVLEILTKAGFNKQVALRTSPETVSCPGCHPQTRSPTPSTHARAPYRKLIRTFHRRWEVRF